MLTGLELGSPQWLPAAIAIALLGWSCVLWSWFRSPVRGWVVALAAICKLIAIGSLALYLVEPLVKTSRPTPGANTLAVLVDNSRSMSIRSPGESESLADRLHHVLNSDAAWYTRASQDFTLRTYEFDSRLRAQNDFTQIAFDGNSSSLGNALDTLATRFANRPVAGVMVLTDGMATDKLPANLGTSESPIPVYPVVDLQRASLKDIAVADPTVTQSVFELAPVHVEATVKCNGLEDREVTVRLIDEKGTTVQTQKLKPDRPTFEKRLRFQYRPKESGIQFVRVRAMLTPEDSDSETSPDSQLEVTTANNSRLLAVDRGGGPYRLLYIGGRSGWDFKFLRRAIEEDDELRLTALIRIAKKEAKFSFRDREVDSTNPLFAGFEDNPDATEQYDEPILLRLGVRESGELQGGFPKTAEELFQYDAIILEDIEAKFFSQEQMLLMRQFVSARGGGLLMLGGSEAFDRGGYRDTPVGDCLPVYLRSTGTLSATASTAPGMAFRLTREGSLEPWMRLRTNETEEAKRLAEMPKFSAYNITKDIKPGASTLATIHGESGESAPALVTQNFGNGRTAALLIADFWRWSMHRAKEDSDDLAQAWRQIARWLTSDVLRRVELKVVGPDGPTAPHRIQIKLRDENYLPLDNAQCEVVVMPPDGKLVPIDATPDPQQPGTMQAEFWSQADGPYVVSVKASGPDGAMIGEYETGWTAEPSAYEFRSLTPDLAPLSDLARQSGGEVLDLDQLDQFITSLPTKRVPITESHIEPLWHRTTLLLLTVLSLCIEWGLRRLRGLP